MDRMTERETITMAVALNNYIKEAWERAAHDYGIGQNQAGDYWASRVTIAKSAYDKAMDWTTIPEQGQ